MNTTSPPVLASVFRPVVLRVLPRSANVLPEPFRVLPSIAVVDGHQLLVDFRYASHAERTKHRRPADARSTLQVRFAPCGFWTPPPRQAVVPFQKTCAVALGLGFRSAPSGQV